MHYGEFAFRNKMWGDLSAQFTRLQSIIGGMALMSAITFAALLVDAHW